MDAHVKAREIGEVLYAPLDVILSETSIVQPDIVYLDPTRLTAVSHRGVEGPPTLAVEILSPATTLIDRSTKHQLYARHGVPEVWVIDLENSLAHFHRNPGGGTYADISATERPGPTPIAMLPGVEIDLSGTW